MHVIPGYRESKQYYSGKHFRSINSNTVCNSVFPKSYYSFAAPTKDIPFLKTVYSVWKGVKLNFLNPFRELLEDGIVGSWNNEPVERGISRTNFSAALPKTYTESRNQECAQTYPQYAGEKLVLPRAQTTNAIDRRVKTKLERIWKDGGRVSGRICHVNMSTFPRDVGRGKNSIPA